MELQGITSQDSTSYLDIDDTKSENTYLSIMYIDIPKQETIRAGIYLSPTDLECFISMLQLVQIVKKGGKNV